MISFKKSSSLLQSSLQTESKFECYLDKVTESQMIFNQLWSDFFRNGARGETTLSTLKQLSENESKADSLRREIEILLFEKTLIPDLRADVMTLIEHLDKIMNLHEAIGFHIKIEQPTFRPEFQPQIEEFLKQVTAAIDHMVLCMRSFISDLQRVREYSQKTIHFETQADLACTALKMTIFDSDMPLDQKVQTRYFVDRIDELANLAEDTVDKIVVYTLKRAI